jgi:DNA invertase Pin-like site-specific DNA recombinase
MIRSAIYIRSSKDLNNVSCETQEKELTQHVKEKGEAVYRVFCDQALSGLNSTR